jgi:hypothetical protein
MPNKNKSRKTPVVPRARGAVKHPIQRPSHTLLAIMLATLPFAMIFFGGSRPGVYLFGGLALFAAVLGAEEVLRKKGASKKLLWRREF